MIHVTISDVINEKIGVEKRFSHSIFFSRLNGKVDKNLSCFFVPFPFFCVCTYMHHAFIAGLFDVGEVMDFGSSFKEKGSFWKNKSSKWKALTTFFVYLQP